MKHRSAAVYSAAALLLVLSLPFASAQQKGVEADQSGAPARLSTVQAAQLALQEAEALYRDGSYDACQSLVEQSIADLGLARGQKPRKELARLRILEALLSYTFRDEGYEQRVTTAVQAALELDLNVDVGNPAEVPPFVLNRFTQIRKEYLARFTRSARRNTFGLVGAMVLEPTIFTDLAVLQPGVFYSFNFSDSLTLDAELRVPLRSPVWNSIRGQVGLIWYPSFRVETLSMGISTTYMFGLDNLSAYTHSLSIGGQGEIVSRSGFGFGANVEMLRIDLLFGYPTGAELPSYSALPILGNLLRMAFANIRMFAFWTY